jgi:hypothetical protein
MENGAILCLARQGCTPESHVLQASPEWAESSVSPINSCTGCFALNWFHDFFCPDLVSVASLVFCPVSSIHSSSHGVSGLERSGAVPWLAEAA